jgi:lambda repressor-like predicted transcriptional regulator
MSRKEDLIKELIRMKEYSLRGFAEYCGVEYNALKYGLDKDIDRMKIKNVVRICKALGITVDAYTTRFTSLGQHRSYLRSKQISGFCCR